MTGVPAAADAAAVVVVNDSFRGLKRFKFHSCCF